MLNEDKSLVAGLRGSWVLASCRSMRWATANAYSYAVPYCYAHFHSDADTSPNGDAYSSTKPH